MLLFDPYSCSSEQLTRIYESPIGPLWMTADEKGLTALHFSGPEVTTGICSRQAQSILDNTAQELDDYFSRKRAVFDVPLHILKATPFQLKIWQVLLDDVGYGEMVSYSQEATLAGHPRACRAAANANHANPIAIIIPCHRVIAAGGKIGGYGAGGIDKKQFLLELEAGKKLKFD